MVTKIKTSPSKNYLEFLKKQKWTFWPPTFSEVNMRCPVLGAVLGLKISHQALHAVLWWSNQINGLHSGQRFSPFLNGFNNCNESWVRYGPWTSVCASYLWCLLPTIRAFSYKPKPFAWIGCQRSERAIPSCQVSCCDPWRWHGSRRSWFLKDKKNWGLVMWPKIDNSNIGNLSESLWPETVSISTYSAPLRFLRPWWRVFCLTSLTSSPNLEN